MKIKLLILFLLAAGLSGCMPEGHDGCPEDLKLVFELKDEYESGDYDSRIANDVLLYIFNDRIFVGTMDIKYEQIAAGKEFRIRKEDYLAGEVDFIAWAVSEKESQGVSVPSINEGAGIGEYNVGLTPVTRANEYYPAECGLYMGTLSMNEQIDVASSHKIELIHSSCRVEVNVTDMSGVLAQQGAKPMTAIYGTMSHMDMEYKGVGVEAVVSKDLKNNTQNTYKSGRFGIMPSSDGQKLKAHVKNGDEIIAILEVPESVMPQGAVAGGLIIFDYVLGEAEFWVTVNGFKHKVQVIEGI